ncbi:MAG: hypothetical protein ACKVGW_21815 [Verrucomicrobiia bacterium]
MNNHHRNPLLKSLKIARAFSIASLILAPFLASNSYAAKVARVFIDSEASVSYNEKKESDNGASYETYVFIKGNFYGGDISDKSLRNVTFEDVIGTVGESMKQRNFYPSASADQGDLLVVVHYGSTSVPQDLAELFGTEMDDPYFDDLKRLSEFGHKNQPGMNNSKLGIGRALDRKNINTTEEFDLRVELEDERYFIILMAYDYEKLRTTKEQELLWTTRFSLPSIGTNFEDAYPALARAASSHYGTSLEKYAKSSTHFGTGSVDIGELKTVGIEETETSEDSKKKNKK